MAWLLQAPAAVAEAAGALWLGFTCGAWIISPLGCFGQRNLVATVFQVAARFAVILGSGFRNIYGSIIWRGVCGSPGASCKKQHRCRHNGTHKTFHHKYLLNVRFWFFFFLMLSTIGQTTIIIRRTPHPLMPIKFRIFPKDKCFSGTLSSDS